MRIAEVFGHGVDNLREAAERDRANRACPFRGAACTKGSRTDPIGVCSLSDGVSATALCPVRFTEREKIFKDAANAAFGPGATFGVFPEVRILKILASEEDERDRKIGKVDYLLGKIVEEKVVDFAAVEVQGVYFSGSEIRTAMNHFIANRALDLAISDRRPDFRSSAQKRLMPQLFLKVPVFRRWGKKFFVVVDSHFYDNLPVFKKANSASNSELTWLVYSFERQGEDYQIQGPDLHYSLWDDVQNALREGVAPEKEEIEAELQTKLRRTGARAARILTT